MELLGTFKAGFFRKGINFNRFNFLADIGIEDNILQVVYFLEEPVS